MAKKIVELTFPKNIINEPIIYNLGHKFKIITNIKRANVTKDEGWVILELEGIVEEIEKGVQWIKSHGIKVSPPGVEMN